TLDGSQLLPKTYILQAFVGTQNSVYNGQASDVPIKVIGAPAFSVTLMGGNTTFVTGGSGTANFSIKANFSAKLKHDLQSQNTPLQLYFMDKNGGNYASQITNGTSACAGIPRVCGNPITLSASEQCCLQLALDGSQLPPMTYILKAFVSTLPDFMNAVFYGQASDLPITVRDQPLTTTLSISQSELALSVNNTALNPALTGNPRVLTITNTGNQTATNMEVNYPYWPGGTPATTASSTCSYNLAPGATCTITITPGQNPSAGTGNVDCSTGIAPIPLNINVSAENAVEVQSSIVILSYGCIYQGGFVFSVDDAYADAPIDGSMGGKVVALSDQAAQTPGVIWSSNGNSGTSADAQNDDIPGISITSTTPSDTCNGATDGFCNTNVITSFYMPTTSYPLTYYAAGVCKATIAGYSDWYLPAICEMNEAASWSGATCPSGIQNIASNLQILMDGCSSGSQCIDLPADYFSSTQIGPTSVWTVQYAMGIGSVGQGAKYGQASVRCVRRLTL
ncbi:MAG: hypothetical protein ACHP65_08615, partial [Legionellales bacterium]